VNPERYYDRTEKRKNKVIEMVKILQQPFADIAFAQNASVSIHIHVKHNAQDV